MCCGRLRTPAGPAPPSLSHAQLDALARGDLAVIDDWLGAATAAEVGGEAAARAAVLRPAGMGRGAARWFDHTERGDELAWLEPATVGPGLGAVFGGLEALRLELNREAYLGLRRFDLQLAQYRLHGARYARHSDAFRAQTGRRLTAIYYLNPDWEPSHGGLLRAYATSGVRDVEPVLDRLVVFLSERVEHEVLPSFALRTALTAWFYASEI